MIDFIKHNLLFLLQGASLSLLLCLSSLFIGIVSSFFVSFGLVYGYPIVRRILRVIIYIIKGTPLLVQVFILYFGLGEVESLNIPGVSFLKHPFVCALIAISLNSCCYMSSIVSAEILKVPRGQIISARLLGISSLRVIIRIMVPQVFRAIYPVLLNEGSILLKSTSIASGITLLELMGRGSLVISETYEVGNTLIVLGTIYILSNFVVMRLIKIIFAVVVHNYII